MPRRRSKLFHFSVFTIALFFLVFGGIYVSLTVRPIREYIYQKVFSHYLKKLEAKLPFKVEEIKITGTWREFLKGQIPSMHLVIHFEKWRLRMDGPIEVELNRKTHHINAVFSPLFTAEPAGHAELRTPPLLLDLSFLADADFSHLDEFHLATKTDHWKWEPAHILLEKTAFSLDWEEGETGLDFSARSIQFAESSPDRDLNLSGVTFSLSAPIILSPLKLGPEFTFDLKAKSGETLWNEQYLDLPLSALPVHGKIIFDRETEKGVVNFGSEKNPKFQLTAELLRKGGELDSVRTQWRSQPLSLRELVAGVLGAPRSDSQIYSKIGGLENLRIRSGTLKTEGKAEIPIHDKFDLRALKIDQNLNLKNISFEWPEKRLAVSGLNLSLPLSTSSGMNAKLSADKILFRKLKMKLGDTQILLHPENAALDHFHFFFGNPTASSIPLSVENFQTTFGNISGTIHLPDAGENRTHYTLLTSAKLQSTPIEPLFRSVCAGGNRLVPASASFDFPKIEITADSIDPTGKARIELFDGFIEASELGFYDINTGVQETDFNLDMDHIRLDRLGDWLGFGEMDGILVGHAHDVTLQASLPTHYDFQIEVKKLNHGKVVFSPDAMKNFTRLFAGEGIDNLPGFADFLAFGWPSRFFGGYDVFYAGVSLFSSGGKILLETLDPPEILEKTRKHFILYGYRFKMPLESNHYPVLLDATSMSNYIHSMSTQLGEMAKAKKRKDKSHENQNDCPAPTL